MKSSIAVLGVVVCVLAFPAVPAQAAPLNCNVVQAVGNALADEILRDVNRHMSGYSQRISKRKTLRVNRIQRVWFEGCKAKFRALVTLKRKVRRDANGHIVMSGVVTRVTPDQVCLSKARVENVSLSRTLKIGERIYKRVANRTIPGRERCYSR